MGWSTWGSDGTWRSWLVAVGVSVVIVWVSIGVLVGDGGGGGFERRGGPALAWTDDGLFVFGGTPVPAEGQEPASLEPLGDAALVDPVDGDVDEVPEPPFDRPLWRDPVAATSGTQVLVIGQRCNVSDDEERGCAPGGYRAALYDLERRDWREVELPRQLQTISNGQSHLAGVTPDGRIVLVLGGREVVGELAGRQLWVFEPAEETWEALPAPGSLIEQVCVSGTAVVVGSGLVARTATAEGASLRVLDLDGDRTWFASAPSGVAAEADRPGLACGDDVVLVAGAVASTRLFRLGGDGGWFEPAPRPGDDVYPLHLWTGDEFLFVGSNASAIAYDPAADEWRGVEEGEGTGPAAVWTGELVVGWRGRADAPVAFPA